MTSTALRGMDAREAAQRLEEACAALESAVVAYSGGVDSAVLLAAAHRALGPRAVGLLAISPSYPQWEYDDAREGARRIGAELVLVDTHEVEDPRYAANPTNRCYFCKSALFDACDAFKARRGLKHVAYGANLDDLGDDRPGHTAARERGIQAPLITAGLSKPLVRAVAELYGLPSAHKPALACLSSRFPHGTAITAEKLGQVGRAEFALRQLGFVQVRVRYHGDLARIEVAVDELPRLLDEKVREAAVAGVREAGFTQVTVDLDGYRQGGANRASGRPRLTVLGG
ncbi:MAG: ATP-dependent sacrificial sulfur transferase LarE [Myxococcota bacterium]